MPDFVPISDAVRGLIPRHPNQIETANEMTSSESINISSQIFSSSGVASADALHITSSSVSTHENENEVPKHIMQTDVMNENTNSQNGQRKFTGIGNTESPPMQNQSGDTASAEQQNTFPDAMTIGNASNRISPNDEKSDVFYGDSHSFFRDSEGGRAREREPNRFSCFKRSSYPVSVYLKCNWKTQANFFTKIMIAKSLQSMVILIWTYIAMYCFGNSLKENSHTNVHYFMLILFLITKMFVISCKGHCTKPEMVRGASYAAWLALAMGIEAISIGTMCASLSIYWEIKTILIATWILLLSYMLISAVPHLSHSSITKWVNAAFELMVVFFVSIIFVAFKAAEGDKSYMHFFLVEWAPAVGIAEAIILGSFLWIREVVFGSLFSAHETDWLFVAACI